MKCKNCGFDEEEWIDITDKIDYMIIDYMIKRTTTPEKLGYIQIVYKERSIGSMGQDGIKLWEDNTFIDNDFIKIKDAFKIITDDFYFNIYIRKELEDKLEQNSKKDKKRLKECV